MAAQTTKQQYSSQEDISAIMSKQSRLVTERMRAISIRKGAASERASITKSPGASGHHRARRPARLVAQELGTTWRHMRCIHRLSTSSQFWHAGRGSDGREQEEGKTQTLQRGQHLRWHLRAVPPPEGWLAPRRC